MASTMAVVNDEKLQEHVTADCKHPQIHPFDDVDANPTLMDITQWKKMVQNYETAGYAPRDDYDHTYDENIVCDEPLWCFKRFGGTRTVLDDGRTIFIAGEHEDSYDPDFTIYNDVVVIAEDNRPEAEKMEDHVPDPESSDGDSGEERMIDFTAGKPGDWADGKCPLSDMEIYNYPSAVFPPTDFHTATLVKDKSGGSSVYIIGGLGYQGSSRQTQVYRLDLKTLSIEPLSTSGSVPVESINRHTAKLQEEGGRIMVTGGSLKETVLYLDIESLTWKS